MKPTSGTYSPQLDHLRFFAAMLVFFWHSLHSKGLLDATYAPDIKLISWLEEGHTGVSLFMVLSGYLLFSIMDGKRIDLVSFFINRVLRIFPLVIFWAICLVDLNARTLANILLSFIPIGTAMQGQGVDGFWSISIELNFYLLVPFLIGHLNQYDDINMRKAGFKKICGLLLLIAFSLFFRSLASFRGEDAKILSYYSIFGRATEFLFGGLALVFNKHFHPKLMTKAWLLFFSSFIFLLFMDKFNNTI